MAATAWTLTNNARMRRAKGNFNVDTATLRCALFQSTSNLGAASTTYAGVTNEVANANGYPTGGVVVDLTFSGTTTIDVVFVSNPTFTATGGNIVARTAAVYEVGGDVYAYSTLDTADVTTSAGNTLIVDSDGSPTPFFTMT